MKRLIALFLAALMITSVGLSTSKVLAIDEIFYSGNDILFYNPDDKTCSTTNIAASGDNKGNAFNFFVSKGIPAIKSAAIVGNLQQESNVEPRALNSSSGAYGIAQWLGGRKTELLKLDYYTSGATDPTKELQVQLEYMWGELQGTEKKAYDALMNSTSNDVKELAILFGEAFERYGEGEEGKRAQYAEEIYNQYGGTVSTGTGACTNAGAGGFVYYSQKDPQWASVQYGSAGTIGEAGCGPTSLAMIVATLVNKSVTPKETAELGAANGSAFEGGTIHQPLIIAAAAKWGFKYIDISNQPFEQAIETVKAGGLVYMGGQGPAPFTSGGHVVVMRGVTTDGKIIIGDPYRNAADVYPRATVEAYRGTTIAITKG